MGTMLVRHEPASASAVRRELALDLDLHGVAPGAVEDVTLVVSELLGNAVRHAGVAGSDKLGVRWTVEPDTVLVSVEDPSPQLPVRRSAPPHALNGRGMTIIDTVSTDWGVERTPGGKRVWARIDRRRR